MRFPTAFFIGVCLGRGGDGSPRARAGRSWRTVRGHAGGAGVLNFGKGAFFFTRAVRETRFSFGIDFPV